MGIVVFGQIKDSDFFELRAENCNSFLDIDQPFQLLRKQILRIHKIDLLTFLN